MRKILSQVALVKIVESAGTYRGESSLEYWASKISFRIALRYSQKIRRREELSTLNWQPPVKTPDAEEQVGMQQIRVRIAELLQQMNESQRTALVLRLVEGHSPQEIAEITGVSVNTVRDRLQVGRKKLRKMVLDDPTLREWAGLGAL